MRGDSRVFFWGIFWGIYGARVWCLTLLLLKEQSYLSKLAAAMQNRVEVPVVRMWLKKAQAEGLDQQRIYEAAVRTRLPQWDPAPPYDIVIPRWG